MDQTFINRIVEAALLASTQPLTVAQLGALFTLDDPAPEGSLRQALDDLQAACADRGVALVELASGWRYQVKSDVHVWVSRLWTERQTRYTRATLETLALIAYRQPITRGEIEQVRGVATNSNIIKALEEREWIRVVGHRDMPGRPELLGTTKGFLDYFGLKRLDELPPLAELKDFAELDPQLRLGDASTRDVGGIQSDASDAEAGDTDTDTELRAETDEAPDTTPGVDLHHAGDRDDDVPPSATYNDITPDVGGDDHDTEHEDAAGEHADTSDPDPSHPDMDADAGDQDLDPQDALAADGDSDRSIS